MTRGERVLRGVGVWTAYYRARPYKLAEEYLHLNLRLFQKILLAAMNINTIFIMIAARGIGKSFISAVFCVIRCILYPGTKICIASGTRGQAINVLEKVLLELKPLSKELELEIDEKETRINGTNAQIVFKNRSYIKVVTSTDSARSNRANILILDEFRLIKKWVIDDVLKKFLTYRRMPRYTELSEEQRKCEWGKEKSMTVWLSSAYTTDHWSYTKCVDTFESMKQGKKRHFICGLPYELSIKEGLLDRSVIEDEYVESDFNELRFQMELEVIASLL